MQFFLDWVIFLNCLFLVLYLKMAQWPKISQPDLRKGLSLKVKGKIAFCPCAPLCYVDIIHSKQNIYILNNNYYTEILLDLQ